MPKSGMMLDLMHMPWTGPFLQPLSSATGSISRRGRPLALQVDSNSMCTYLILHFMTALSALDFGIRDSTATSRVNKHT
jgi:hypothetical protein